MDAINKILCQLQLDAEGVVDAYDYGLSCAPTGLCRLITQLWAKELVALDSTCDRSKDVKRYTDTVKGKDGYTDPDGIVTTDCTTTFTDITPANACEETTFTVLL